eukprot:355163-Chlamydomonas_euryale.AAC.2
MSATPCLAQRRTVACSGKRYRRQCRQRRRAGVLGWVPGCGVWKGGRVGRVDRLVLDVPVCDLSRMTRVTAGVDPGGSAGTSGPRRPCIRQKELQRLQYVLPAGVQHTFRELPMSRFPKSRLSERGQIESITSVYALVAFALTGLAPGAIWPQPLDRPCSFTPSHPSWCVTSGTTGNSSGSAVIHIVPVHTLHTAFTLPGSWTLTSRAAVTAPPSWTPSPFTPSTPPPHFLAGGVRHQGRQQRLPRHRCARPRGRPQCRGEKQGPECILLAARAGRARAQAAAGA